ncbi:MAG: 3D domain-containing protein [Armatimonadota bacterium]|nr:3D domain-containing protein [Armatimonadota bacterium]
MRGGMPSPPHGSPVSVLALPARRSSSAWLSPLLIGLTVALAGASTGYSAANLRQPGVQGPVRRHPQARALSALPFFPPAPSRSAPSRAEVLSPVLQRRPAPVPDPLARLVDDPVVRQVPARPERAIPLTVIADGKVYQLKSASRTPGEALDDLQIRLRPGDRIFPAGEGPLWPGATVRVIRIRTAAVAKRVPLPVPVVYRSDPTLPRGRVVVTRGRPGVKVQRFLQTFADGKLVSQSFLSQEVIRPSTPQVVRRGTRFLVASRGAFTGYEYLDMVATAYAPWCCRGVDHVTATGRRAGYGVVAVDPRVIPLGSRVYVEGYGYAIAGDVGSAIKGLRIDLGMDTTRLARQFGRRSVRVYIIQKAPPKRPANTQT